MIFEDFLMEMLGITEDFSIVAVQKEEAPEKLIEIHIKYVPNSFTKDGGNARTEKTELLWIFFGIHTANAVEIGKRIKQAKKKVKKAA